jgi:hypothetical protein
LRKTKAGYCLKFGDPRIPTVATQIAQMFRLALFPKQTAAFGYYVERDGGKPFHLARYAAMEEFLLHQLVVKGAWSSLILEKFRGICHTMRYQRKNRRLAKWNVTKEFLEFVEETDKNEADKKEAQEITPVKVNKTRLAANSTVRKQPKKTPVKKKDGVRVYDPCRDYREEDDVPYAEGAPRPPPPDDSDDFEDIDPKTGLPKFEIKKRNMGEFDKYNIDDLDDD